MMQRLSRSVMTLAFCLLAGCAGTQPSRFYMLTAVPPEGGTPIPARASTTIAVGLQLRISRQAELKRSRAVLYAKPAGTLLQLRALR